MARADKTNLVLPRQNGSVSVQPGERNSENSYRLMALPFFALFFFTRLYNLTMAGMYWDEPLYLYWGQVIGSDWNQRYMGAVYLSRQPLHTWLVALSERIISDPLLAGRIVSVIAGTFTVIAVWLLAKRLFSYRVAFLSVLLYTVVPYTLHFDRTALTDSLLCAENIWMFYLSIRLLDRRDALSTFGVTISVAMALLTKSYGRAFPLLLPVALLSKKRNELTFSVVINWAIMLLFALAAGFEIYYFLFSSTIYAALIDGGDVGTLGFIMPLSVLVTFPLDRWGGNAAQVIQWFAELATVPLSIVGMLAILLSPRFGARVVSLSMLVVLPIAGSILVANVFYERYILYTIPFFLILTAFLLDRTYSYLAARRLIINKRLFRRPLAGVFGCLAFCGLLIPSFQSDFVVLTDFEKANVFASGYYGINESADYLAGQAKDHVVYVIANDLSRPAADGPAVLLRNVPNIEYYRVKPDFGGSEKLMITDPSTGLLISKDYFAAQDVYYVFEVGIKEDAWLEQNIDLVVSFPNLKGDDSAIGLYRIRFDDSFQ